MRQPLSPERAVKAAIDIADELGIDAVSMRRLGQQLGVEAMSLYNHVANKEQLLDLIVDEIASRFVLPVPEPDWKASLRASALSAYRVQLRHPWSCALMNSRQLVGPARLEFANAVLGCFREAGFSVQLAHHALHAFDGHITGFTLQQVRSVTRAGLGPNVAAVWSGETSDRYPWVYESVTQSTHDDDTEYLLMLDIILDGLERLRDA